MSSARARIRLARSRTAILASLLVGAPALAAVQGEELQSRAVQGEELQSRAVQGEALQRRAVQGKALEAPEACLEAPSFFEAGGGRPEARVWLLGQVAKRAVIPLTASNGFFDRSFQAAGSVKSTAPASQYLTRSSSFRWLVRGRKAGPGTVRWHLWIDKPGEVNAELFSSMPRKEAGEAWTLRVGQQEKQLIVRSPSDASRPQTQALRFVVKQRGRVSVVLSCGRTGLGAATKIHGIRLSGTALVKARLLRARWRPAAVHMRFASAAPAPRLWVFESEALDKNSSYSPITTPFGYFGTSFRDGGIPAGASFNFSLWIAKRGERRAPTIDRTARLIATGLPAARFSFFGHEGSGVKFRDAIAYPRGARRVIQALRAEFDEATGLVTYYAYFYDEAAARWRLFGCGQKPPKQAEAFAQAVEERGTLPSAGCFVEVPGPPARERSGDLVRTLRRRAWFLGRDERWYPARPVEDRPRPRRRKQLLDALENDPASLPVGARWGLVNKRRFVPKNGGSSGWFAMSCGGIEYRLPSAEPVAADLRARLDRPTAESELPPYLAGAKSKQLLALGLPTRFVAKAVLAVGTGTAKIRYELAGLGGKARATLWYGLVDCATFTPQAGRLGSPVLEDLFAAERTWRSSLPSQRVVAGPNVFDLSGLDSGTKYYYRLFVEHAGGKAWELRSGSFRTQD